MADSPGPTARLACAAPGSDLACHMCRRSSTPSAVLNPATSGYDLRAAPSQPSYPFLSPEPSSEDLALKPDPDQLFVPFC